jgi:secretion/DNA translocation related TadE-like protein
VTGARAGSRAPRRSERGSASLLAAAALLVLALLLGVGVAGLLLQVGAHRVQGAADLAALAGAHAKAAGTDDPCAAASRAAAADGVHLDDCRAAGDELTLVVTITVRGGAPVMAFGRSWGEVTATAHAGVRGT